MNIDGRLTTQTVEERRILLARALSASGYEIAPADERLTPLAEKLELIRETGRYTRLLANFFAANDRANLRGLVLEATFAFHFEMAEMPLQYEVRHRPDDETSVDFLRRTECGKELCIEMRLVQQRQAITTLFEKQIHESVYFGTTLDGPADRADTLRLQRLILEKAVAPDGRLIKFRPEDTNSYNIVAVEVSELHLGMIDDKDCVLAAYGDPHVPDYARRGLFGLFQEPRPEYPDHIQEVAAMYAPFRDAVHAVLFLRQEPPVHPINYNLEYILIHNRQLVASAEAEQVAREFYGAMNPWKSVRNRD